MSDLTQSMTVAIQTALRELITALALDGMPDVQVREDYYFGDVPFEGCTIHDLGEKYHPGVIGMHDVGYQNGITLVVPRTGDAIVNIDPLPTWREIIRRRLQVQRLPVGEADGIRHHVCRVEDGRPRNAQKFNHHRIQQLIVTVWNREPRKIERTRP